MKRSGLVLSALLFAHAAVADVALTDKVATLRHLKPEKIKAHHSARLADQSFHLAATATGSIHLVDAGGLGYFINSDVTFNTSSSASGAASEASYTHAVAASTADGGTSMTTLNDMFDGYNAMCVSLTNSTGPCVGLNPDANFVMYNKNGPASADTSVPAVAECTNRQFVLGTQTIGGLQVQRKVYVPNNDRYIRWMNVFTNTSGAPITFTMITSNNLGSDSNTLLATTSSGDAVVTTGDLWATSFQAFSGNTSTDPRIGHVFQGSGAPTPVSNINFVNGDDNPYWSYSITLAPGQTKIIVNYATGMPTKALAAAEAASLAAFGASAQQCMSATELSEVANFQTGSADLAIVKSAGVVDPDVVFAGGPVHYTLAVTNSGPTAATSVTVTDVLPAGFGFVSASGSGWTCGFASGTVTCTTPSLGVGAASPIALVVTAPSVSRSAFIANTATVASGTSDPNPANNSSTTTIHVVPGRGNGH